MALPTQTVYIPLAAGLRSRVDPRALQPPDLAICQNAQFDDEGGLQPRLPYASFPNTIVGGGSINVRRLAVYGDELLAFTADALYTWSERDQGWLYRGDHPAPVIDEKSVFVRSAEQTGIDRAEMGGTVVWVWVETTGSTVEVKVAATDSTTGAVILAPKSLGASTTRPNLLALSTRILLVYENSSGDLVGQAIDPANVNGTTGSPTTLAAAANYNLRFDMCRSTTTPADALLVFRRDTTTSYSVMRIPELNLAGATTVTKARTSDRSMAVASAPSGDRMAVIRGVDATGLVKADVLVESTLADSTVDVTIGSTSSDIVVNVAAAFQTVAQAGTFRCYAIWSRGSGSSEDVGPLSFTTGIGYITASGTGVSVGRLAQNVAPIARAFDYSGRVFFWVAFFKENLLTEQPSASLQFKAALQNSYFLIRDDGLLVAKAVTERAGGRASVAGRMATVQQLSQTRYVFAGEERRILRLDGKFKGYDAREPVEVVATFDDDDARRAVQLGETLYLPGGQILQYDGEALTEVGFHYYPYTLDAVATATAGNPEAGFYAVKSTWRRDNAKGERERSTTATTAIVTIAGSFKLQVTPKPLEVTRKVGQTTNVYSPGLADVVVEFWRTRKNPAQGAGFLLVSGIDPAVTTGDNRFVPNSPGSTISALLDNLADASLGIREQDPETGGVLGSNAPPPARVIAASQDRLLVGAVANNAHQIFPSKIRTAGEVAAFNGDLALTIPPEGGRIMALAHLQETLVAFKERAIFALPGDGFSNTGAGQQFGPPRLLSGDVGAESQRAVILFPGGLLFKSLKGWYVLAGWQAPDYVGDAVAEFDDEEVKAISLVETQHQVRIMTSERMLVWDYLTNRERGGAWSEWPMADGLDSVVWRGSHMVVANSGEILKQATTFAGATDTCALDVETAWIQTAGIAGFQRIYEFLVTGEYRSDHRLRIRTKYNYDDSAYVDDVYKTPSVAIAGRPLQTRYQPSRQQCEAIKIRLTVNDPDTDDLVLAGEGARLTGITLRYGMTPGLFRQLSPAQL